jgi:hypothetical protein
MSGSITLGAVAKRTDVLNVACSRCDRAGRYILAVLIARHGADFGIPTLLRQLAANCPKRKSISAYDLCGVDCRDLSALFLKPPESQ